MDGVGTGGNRLCVLSLLTYTSQAPSIPQIQLLSFEFNQPSEPALTGVGLSEPWVGNKLPTLSSRSPPPPGQPRRKEAG